MNHMTSVDGVKHGVKWLQRSDAMPQWGGHSIGGVDSCLRRSGIGNSAFLRRTV